MNRRPPSDPDAESPAGGAPRPRPVSLQDEYEERFHRPRGAAPPPPRSRAPQLRSGGVPIGCITLVAVVVLLFILGPILLNLSVDWQWFGSLGFQDVFGTRLTAALGVWVVGFVLAALFLAANGLIARRIATPRDLFPGQQPLVPAGITGLLVALGVALGALIMAFAAAGEWTTTLAYLNHTPFGTTDPLFHLDTGFYVFELPFYEFLRGWGLGLVVLTAIGAGLIYALRPDLFVTGQRITLDPRVVAHFTLLGVAFLALMAVGYWFAAYDLLFSAHANFFGASYTDVNARLLANRILLVVTVAIALLLLVNLRRRAWRLLAGAAGVWVLALLLIGGIYPSLIQNFVVKPSELENERPYILNNITATRAAFGLENFKTSQVQAETQLNPADIQANRGLVDSVRLWDYRPLLATYNQLQALRPYFTFRNVDLDRYPLAGGETQVMIAARELNVNGLQPQARTWLNQHLVYTHGYGIAASSVNQIENAGQPHFVVHDLPSVSEDPALAVTRPQIYYGEAEDNYVFVHTGTQEFDYPSGDQPVMTTYTGTGGVQVGGFLNRLQLAAYFGDFTILLSDLIHADSRVLFNRDIHDMVGRVAPFLQFDRDPYVVVVGGKLYWIQDAYTVTDRYPNSTPFALGDTSINYIRNSVKIVIDAYNGTMDFYVVDNQDPIIATYRHIFPTLFKDGAQMPAALRSHLRFPEDMFNIQANMYENFHMTNPEAFYNRDDAWRVPLGDASDTAAPLEAYYTMMRLPGDTQNQFMLLVPFTTASKPNMIAWMGGRGDPTNYGQVDVIRFPPNTVVYGPQQISATINQDPTISAQLTLWNQSGSSVLHGNMLVIPLGSSVLYVQPLFLEATSNALPELKRVITAAGGQVGMGESLSAALDAMFSAQARVPPQGAGSGGTPAPPGPGQSPIPPAGSPGLLLTPGGLPGGSLTPAGPCSGNVRSLSADALTHYQRAQDALKLSDWATYGQEQAQVQADLRCLQQVAP